MRSGLSASTSVYSQRWVPPYTPTTSDQIEATSYLLLTYVWSQQIDEALPHLKWLVSKQNELGGYSSTQVRKRCTKYKNFHVSLIEL